MSVSHRKSLTELASAEFVCGGDGDKEEENPSLPSSLPSSSYSSSSDVAPPTSSSLSSSSQSSSVLSKLLNPLSLLSTDLTSSVNLALKFVFGESDLDAKKVCFCYKPNSTKVRHLKSECHIKDINIFEYSST